MLTKIIHQVWLGAKPVPNAYRRMAVTWQREHPDWRYKLWTDADVDVLVPHFKMSAGVWDCLEPILRADVLRLELVRLYGGMYVDMDMECLRSVEDLLTEGRFHYSDEADYRPTNAWFYAEPNSEMAELLCGLVARRCQQVAKQRISQVDVIDITGATLLRTALGGALYPWVASGTISAADGTDLVAYFADDVALLKPAVLSPFWPASERWRWDEAMRLHRVADTWPHLRGVHHYGWSWTDHPQSWIHQ